jgi:hypothetical protein
MGQAKWDRKMKACRSKMPGQDCQYTIKYRTARTGLQCRTAKTGLPGHDFRERTAREDFAMI